LDLRERCLDQLLGGPDHDGVAAPDAGLEGGPVDGEEVGGDPDPQGVGVPGPLAGGAVDVHRPPRVVEGPAGSCTAHGAMAAFLSGFLQTKRSRRSATGPTAGWE